MVQKVYSNLDEAQKEIVRKGYNRVFLVTGKDSFDKLNLGDRLSRLNGINVFRYCNFTPNPKIEDVERGIELYRRFNPNYVIAIGGGSVIDMAKSIKGLAHEEDPKSALINNKRIERNGTGMLAVPTTAGSGSESTPYAVVYIDGMKYSFHQPIILPVL